jgi:DNA-directed RNA polymerase sigma subunit (sigma70/sigma32)
VTKKGSIKINFPDNDPLDIPETCVLDVADRGGATLDEAGNFMNLSRERIRQIEASILSVLQYHEDIEDLKD